MLIRSGPLQIILATVQKGADVRIYTDTYIYIYTHREIYVYVYIYIFYIHD